MLHKRGFYKTFKDNDLQCTVVEVPCVGDNILLLIVPKLGRLDRIEQRLTAELIKKYLRQTRTSTLDFYMPKINFEGQINADYALLGMNFPIFGDDADFSGISEQSRLKVSHIAHKILFDVPEEEIEAKSASSIQGFVVPAPVLRVDRPFFAMVYNKPTDTILLLGRYMDPER
ncbi:serine protease inhibitor A6-like [Mixophyes fleayi]|uniref:serine protease inhibitor A6-like n=1 Tax=Mixophyes fleayi TaxID=3061075 RepID=UPI003F4D7E5D